MSMYWHQELCEERPRGSLHTLLHPRGQSQLFLAMGACGLLLGWLGVGLLGLPFWGAAVLLLALLAYPALRKWYRDWQTLGLSAMLLSMLLTTQTLHTVEHVTQWVQYHILGWPVQASNGIISPLNAEWIHFTWNLAVLLVVLVLLLSGVRNIWMWLLLLWAGAHTAEHVYLFIQYLSEAQRLASLGLSTQAAEGLPGFFGQGGVLANNKENAGPVLFICTTAPGLTNASRLDVHFWWNVGEIALLLPAAHVGIRTVVRRARSTRSTAHLAYHVPPQQ